LVIAGNTYATTYNLPTSLGDRVVEASAKETVTVTADHDQTLLDVARRYNLGQTEIVTINPNLDRWLVKKEPLYAYLIDVFCPTRLIMG
jgi:hypothetical protein